MLVRPTTRVAAALVLFAVVGCGGQSSNQPNAGAGAENDPFGNTNVTYHSSELGDERNIAKSDVRRTKTHPQKRDEELPPGNLSSSYGMVGDRPAERSTAPSRKTARESSMIEFGGRKETKPEHPIVASIGGRAPDLNVALAGGGQLSLVRHHESKVLVVALWASYNHLCKEELPALQKAVAAFPEEQVQLIAVNDGEGIDTIKAYLAKYDLDITVGVDLEQKVADAFLVNRLPFVAIIDQEGVIQGIHVGYVESLGDDVVDDLKALVSGQSIIEKSKERLSRQISSTRSGLPSTLDERAVVQLR